MNYSTFIAQVQDGNVRSVTIQDNQVIAVLAALIDSEVQSILREAYTTVLALLSTHYDQLKMLAQVLMEREQLNRAQFEALLQERL